MNEVIKKKICAIVEDARMTAYQDGKAGEQIRIGHWDFVKKLIDLWKE